MTEWALIITINCSEPRLPFREFYEKVTTVKYPGRGMEELSAAFRRIAEATASYQDYVATRMEKCR